MLNTPIISTDVGVAKELIENYNCDDIIQYDENKLAEVMLRYLNKYDGYKNIFNIGNEYNNMYLFFDNDRNRKPKKNLLKKLDS